ncbi:MAG TPA: MarR family transcriptional regulator [Ktedonobacterales bacterium]|nr:MarR family transcriptional regulator [Ktedonobacterales bacterium]HEX5570070.1 MarR family transcriptional regulator [Ktedonobacterales bacterium]
MTTLSGNEKPQAHATRRAGADTIASATPPLSKAEIEGVAALRYALRRFSRRTEVEARRIGLTPQQYFLLLAIKGFPSRETANITELAERLQVRHNAVIGLVNRAEERGLVKREPNGPGEDRRIVQVRVTQHGEETIQRLANVLRDERRRLATAAQAIDEAQQR